MYIIVGSSCERSGRLEKVYSSPLWSLFFTMPPFVTFNKFLQREDPIIYVMHDQLHSFVNNLLGKFVSVSTIRDAMSAGDITCVDYDSMENQLAG